MAEAKDRKTRMAELKAAREKEYFDAQAAAKTATEGILPDLPASDVFNYSYAWRQDVGAPTGEYKLIKTPNGLYDPSTNEIVDPVTGARTPMTLSMWSGPSSFRADAANVKNPKTGLTKAQEEAAALLAQAKGNATTLAAQLGAKIDPKTGKVDTSTIDPAKAAAWYNSQFPSKTVIDNNAVTTTDVTTNPIVTTNTATSSVIPTATSTGLTSAQSKSLGAFEIFRSFLNQYGLGALAADVEKYKLDGLSDDELLIRLRTESPAYKRRFAANEARTQKGLTALSEAAYISLEDQYQDVMRRYGMPESYYTRGDMGRQEGFEKFIANDVSPVELEDRVQTAYNRVINANPEVGIALRNFYPGITNGDVLAYALDPNRALSEIQRKITAAEIGGAAVQSGLTTNESDAEYLARYGITKEQAQQGYRTISGYLPRAQQLSSIYGKQVEGGPYTQASAEREIFNVPGAAEEERKRLKIAGLEQAAFGGSSGLTGGALGRERAGQF